MSHLRPENRPKRTLADCRKGRHAYGGSQSIGAGIQRRVCETCGEVTIDLTDAEPLRAPPAQADRGIKSRRRGS